MTQYSTVDMVAEEGQDEYIDTDQIDSLLELFDMHNLIPKLSKHEHVFATSLAMLVTSLHWSGNVRHLFESLPYSPYAKTLCSRKFTSSFIDAIFAATNNLYLIAK